MLRRSYSYNDDALLTGESSRRGGATTFDAGLFFVAYQLNPRMVFIPIYAELAEGDALRKFTAHTGSALAAIPPAAKGPDDWIGKRLLSGA